MYHYTRVLHELSKKNILIIQMVYKTAFSGGFQLILNFFFFLSSKGCTLSCHTFIHHTLISYTLFDLHITIGILTPLMMFGEKFSFRFFIIFWTKPLETLFTCPMRTHNLCMGMNFVPLYKGVTITMQDKYTNYIRGYTTLPFVKDFNRFWTTHFLFLSFKDRTLP